jgi:hypothetical protein
VIWPPWRLINVRTYGKTKAGSIPALVVKKGSKTFSTTSGIHANSGVGHLNDNAGNSIAIGVA